MKCQARTGDITNVPVPKTCCVLEKIDHDNPKPVDAEECTAHARAGVSFSQFVHTKVSFIYRTCKIHASIF